MIKVTCEQGSCLIESTKFPDGTSQVWKLSPDILKAKELKVTWLFENEREIIDLWSLRALVPTARMTLHVPYLPYARQDKYVDNEKTFNLRVFAEMINWLHFAKVTAVDAHNPGVTKSLINNFENLSPEKFHEGAVRWFQPDCVLFPDAGARDRYETEQFASEIPRAVCDKVRDQMSGKIVGLKVPRLDARRVLIVDDLCDGGATFVGVCRELRGTCKTPLQIGLAVTHGLFSNGRAAVEFTGGVDKIFTTNSLLRNGDGFDVQ